MRWKIVENKRLIETENLEGHREFLEMSGEQVSGLVNYGVENGKLVLTRDIVFPSFRTQPNNTHGSYCIWGVTSPELLGDETFDKAQLNGILTFYSHTDTAAFVRRFYQSTT